MKIMFQTSGAVFPVLEKKKPSAGSAGSVHYTVGMVSGYSSPFATIATRAGLEAVGLL